MPGKSMKRADYERLAERVDDYGKHRTEEFMPRTVAKDAAQAIRDLCLMVWGVQAKLLRDDPWPQPTVDVKTGDKL